MSQEPPDAVSELVRPGLDQEPAVTLEILRRDKPGSRSGGSQRMFAPPGFARARDEKRTRGASTTPRTNSLRREPTRLHSGRGHH